jgi:hypothetical protein
MSAFAPGLRDCLVERERRTGRNLRLLVVAASRSSGSASADSWPDSRGRYRRRRDRGAQNGDFRRRLRLTRAVIGRHADRCCERKAGRGEERDACSHCTSLPAAAAGSEGSAAGASWPGVAGARIRGAAGAGGRPMSSRSSFATSCATCRLARRDRVPSARGGGPPRAARPAGAPGGLLSFGHVERREAIAVGLAEVDLRIGERANHRQVPACAAWCSNVDPSAAFALDSRPT